MKKFSKKSNIILAIIVIMAIVASAICYKLITNHFYTINAVIVEVSDTGLFVIKADSPKELISLGFTDEGNIGFKQGQEISISFDGTIMESYPARLGHVKKIKIINEKSDIQIPESVLRYCYSSINNVKVTISELTNSEISLTIVDTNQYPYEYSHSYTIYKKGKNKNYTGIGYKIGEDTENFTSGYTRNRSYVRRFNYSIYSEQD